MSKKFLAFALALCMVFSLVPMSVMAQESGAVFTDVAEDDFFFEPVLWAVEEGITNGMTATTFGPYELCNRAHIVTFLWRANGSPKATKVVNPFMDVNEGDFWYDAALWALENGITNGTSEYMFGATEPCTRAQVVSFIYRANGKPAYDVENPFTDIEEGTFYYDAALWALAEGITTGTTETTFTPDDTVTRAEAVTFLYRSVPTLEEMVEAAADAYWADLDNQLKTGAGYPNGAEGMGAVVFAMKDGEIILNKAYGYAHYFDAAPGSDYWNPTYQKIDNPREMTVDTLFDLASVTKVMATTQSIMLLVDRGLLKVTDTVNQHWPEFTGDGKENITVHQLLTHSSGLPQWEATFLYCDTHEEQMKYIEGLKIVPEYRTDGGEPKYSDFSFMTLGFLVEKITGVPMEDFVKENVYVPLGMTSTGYCPLDNGFTKDQIAATSLGNPYEWRMVDEARYPGVGYDCNKDVEAFAAFTGWRNYTLIGEVNDGNCGMGGGGIAGHAGLFSTASDLGKLLQCMLDGGKYIDANGNEAQLYSEETVKLFTTKHTCYAENHNGSLSEEFGYGFKLDQSWMGKTATENVFGHDGFTGTTVFADPDNGYIFICLTNKMQSGFRTATSNNYYNTNSWVSWNMNQAVKDVLGI